MRIYLPNNSQQNIGGGWSFIRNFTKGCDGKAEITHNPQDADTLLIVGASMTDVDVVEEAKKRGAKIIFRVDNVPKKSRNKRGRIYDKMAHFTRLSDLIIFQSNWAFEYAGWWYRQASKKPPVSIIHNGVDLDVFYPPKDDRPGRDKGYLFVQYNRDENKRWPEAAMIFHQLHCTTPGIHLTIVGNFSPETIDADFDFFAGEEWRYIPPIEEPIVLAEMMRDNGNLLFPAYADASPNTLLEALACGMKPVGLNSFGGSLEVFTRFSLNGAKSIQMMASEYIRAIKNLS